MGAEVLAARLRMPDLRSLPGQVQSTLTSAHRRFRTASLRFKIVFLTVVLLTTTSLVLCLMTGQIANRYLRNEIIKRGESVGQCIAAAAGYSLLSQDVLGLDNLVFKARSANADMAYALIVDQHLRTIVDSESPETRGTIVPADRGLIASAGRSPIPGVPATYASNRLSKSSIKPHFRPPKTRRSAPSASPGIPMPKESTRLVGVTSASIKKLSAWLLSACRYAAVQTPFDLKTA